MKLTACFFAAAVIFAGLSVTPAGAHHDRIYGPCDTEYGFVHMTYDDWAAQIALLEADGSIPVGVVFRYYEELHGGKGNEDPRVVWARNLTDGQILSLDDWANGDYPEIEALMFASGIVPEWILDASGVVRRFDDPYWAQANPLTPTWTVWQSLCMAKYGRSIPVYEMVDEVWTTNIPATTTTSPPTTTTPTVIVTTTTEPVTTKSGVPAVTTTVAPTIDLADGYDLFDAEWDGYPFEKTILLLEERYPPGTPDRFHFRLSIAVEFLRGGGMVRGLDNLWESG
jgi:hypothetical protein